MHDFQLIALGERGAKPFVTRHDIEVQFHSHAVRFHSQLLNQAAHSQGFREKTFFAVQHNFHPDNLRKTEGQYATARGLREVIRVK
jgi:hypothetical protein